MNRDVYVKEVLFRALWNPPLESLFLNYVLDHVTELLGHNERTIVRERAFQLVCKDHRLEVCV